MQKPLKSSIDLRQFPNRPSTIVCIGGNGTILTYRGVPLGLGRVAVIRKQGVGELSRAEEPEDRHWTVTIGPCPILSYRILMRIQ